MKQRLKPVAISLCMLGIISTPVMAHTSSAQMDKLARQVSLLQQQVSQLQSQLNAKNNHSSTSTASSTRRHKKSAAQVATDSRNNTDDQSSGSDETNLPSSGTTYLPVDVDVPGQSFVSSGPYIGIPLQFSGSNLIINNPSVNQDVALLKVRKNIHQRLESLGVIEAPDHAHVLLSGIIEGQGIYKDIGGGTNSTDIDLTNATLDAYILGPEWVSGLMSLTYDNSIGTQTGTFASNSRDLNSRVYITQAFATIGNLSKSPLYGTFGQMYVPFGTYSSNMVSSPLTTAVARTKARAIVLGYQQQADNAFYAAGYVFKGDSHAGATSRVNNGGVNLGYHFVRENFNGDIGAGVIANIADSVGMQFVGNTPLVFNGFGGVNGTGNERIAHRVPAYDVRALLSLGSHIDLLAEYITASTHFNKNDLTMNRHGAKPQALNAEAAFTFNAFSRPSSIAVGYGMTKDALALELPAQRYSMVFNTSIWRDTLQSLELRHDVNYGKSNFATGSNVVAPQASGQPDNIITAQFDYYF